MYYMFYQKKKKSDNIRALYNSVNKNAINFCRCLVVGNVEHHSQHLQRKWYISSAEQLCKVPSGFGRFRIDFTPFILCVCVCFSLSILTNDICRTTEYCNYILLAVLPFHSFDGTVIFFPCLSENSHEIR